MTSLGSSTGVRNRMMLAAPAMPNARASELPMMIIIIAPDTQSSVCACSIERAAVARRRLMDGGDEQADQRRGDELQELDERLQPVIGGAGAACVPGRNASVAAVSMPASSSGHRMPAQTSAAHSTAPAVRDADGPPRPRRHPRGLDRVVDLEDAARCESSSTRETAAARPRAESVPPTRCAEVWPRTSARMPALSIADTPLRSTIEMAIAAAEQLLDMALERLGGAARHERLHAAT